MAFLLSGMVKANSCQHANSVYNNFYVFRDSRGYLYSTTAYENGVAIVLLLLLSTKRSADE